MNLQPVQLNYSTNLYLQLQQAQPQSRLQLRHQDGLRPDQEGSQGQRSEAHPGDEASSSSLLPRRRRTQQGYEASSSSLLPRGRRPCTLGFHHPVHQAAVVTRRRVSLSLPRERFHGDDRLVVLPDETARHSECSRLCHQQHPHRHGAGGQEPKRS